MSPRTIRRAVLAVCVAGIAGMVVSYVREANGPALTFGLITAVAITNLMVATAVAGPASGEQEELGRAVEARIAALVAAGADEAELRQLTGDAVRLGGLRR